MTTSAAVVDLVFAAVQAADIAGFRLYDVRAFATQADQVDSIVFELPTEDARPFHRGAVEFTVTATLPIVVRAAQLAAPAEAGAQTLKGRLAAAVHAVKGAILRTWAGAEGNGDLGRALQSVPFIRAAPKLDDGGQELAGQWLILVGLEFVQTLDDFLVDGDFADLTGVTLTTDAADVFDPTGTYTNPAPPFPDAVKPAPRTSGPDGRAEHVTVLDDLNT